MIFDIGLFDVDGCMLMVEFCSVYLLLLGIVLSGYGMDEDIVCICVVGFVEYFMKLVNVGVFERVIERIFFGKF